MPGTHSVKPVTLESFCAIDDLPTDAHCLLGDSLFDSIAWWRCVEAESMPVGSAARYLLCRTGGRATVLLPLCRSKHGALGSLTTPYTCLFGPVADRNLPQVALDTSFTALMRYCRTCAVTRLEALDPAQAATAMIPAAARRAGLIPLQFAHFGNWYEDVGALDWPRYLAGRPGALRETIRRRLRDADRTAETELTMVDGPAGLTEAIAAYETVYARSWKEPEPFPRFNPALMRALAPGGTLRLGIWRVGDQPVAAQFWVVERGRARLLKLAHDEAFKARSPGTVLTALMLRWILQQDRVLELDFGRGDDPYKRGWASRRRVRFGTLVVNPLRPAAWPVLARHLVGRIARNRSRSVN